MNSGIYALVDPRTFELRYIGLSENLKSRRRQHSKPNSSTQGPHLMNWIQNLQKDNLKPEFLVLEYCSIKDLSENEVFWISYFKGLGCRLTNLTSGGEQFYHAKESKQKISNSLLGHEVLPETREKLRQAALKQPKHIYTSEQKKALSEARKGMKFSEEHRKNIGLSVKGRKVPNKKGLVIVDNFGNQFVSASKAALFHNMTISTVCRLVSGEMKTSSTGLSFKKVSG